MYTPGCGNVSSWHDEVPPISVGFALAGRRIAAAVQLLKTDSLSPTAISADTMVERLNVVSGGDEKILSS